ncbi:NPCBM/NEW2 domain-containing protein [Anaerostipes sp.]|uniref:NPCBM/NEW2 domain-containing protein n=1 Tax=Anaerostipes sp. TaxID=1872530 RepID=UPI0025BA2BAC|nr:NPCBM/NEW2 domain-containing protein [Anaerostipes sp.]MBS7007383.1 NPCBM/NEW2 domain-containing protein [Anaerostipes sp.]
MEKSKWIIKVGVPIITAVIGVYGGNTFGKDKAIQKIQQEVNIDMDSKNYVEEIKKLVKENAKLEQENNELKKASNKIQRNDANKIPISKTSNNKQLYLLDVTKAINSCYAYEERRGETMSLRGRTYSNGFIMGNGGEDGVEFNLKKKYNTISFDLGHVDDTDKQGKFSVSFYSDGNLCKVISMKPEDPVKHYDVNINEAEIIKISWESIDGFTTFGMANVKVQ